MWPLVGLAACTVAGVVLGPLWTLLTAAVGIPALVLYLEKGILPPRGQLAVIVTAVVLTVALLFMSDRGVTWLQRVPAPAAATQLASGQAKVTAEVVKKGGLQRTQLRGQVLDKFLLDGVSLRDLDLSGASLVQTHLRDADLRDVVLRGADLRQTDLRGACLDRAVVLGTVGIDRAYIAGAHLAGATLPADAPKAWKAATRSPCPWR